MKKQRFLLAVLLVFVMVSISTAEKSWGIYYTGTTFDSMKKGIKNVNSKTGLIPVGISMYGGKVYFMFVQNRIHAKNYYIQTFPKTSHVSTIKGYIREKVNEGWVPFDLTFATDKIAVLYLKGSMKVDSWKLITTARSFNAIQTAIPEHRGYFPLGFAFTNTKTFIILVRSANAGVSRWLIKNCGTNNSEVNPVVNGKIGEGYKVYGFEYQGQQVGICFLKQR